MHYHYPMNPILGQPCVVDCDLFECAKDTKHCIARICY